jgi:type IV secretion system protein VirB4
MNPSEKSMPLLLSKTHREKLAARECPISRYIPISHLNSPNIFETKNGAQGCVIAVKGCPFEVIDRDDLNWKQRLLANALLTLNHEFAVYVTTHRRKHNIYPSGDFPSGFANEFNSAYREKFSKQSLYVNDIYLTVMIKGTAGNSLPFTKKLLHRPIQNQLDYFRQQQQQKLKRAVANLMHSLTAFSPHQLGDEAVCRPSQDHSGNYSELLSFFALLINGEKNRVRYPLSDISAYLPTRRISFGADTLEWQGNSHSERQFAALVSIKKYSADSACIALDHLLNLDFEYINTHSFLIEKNEVALESIHKQSKHLFDANDASISQQDQLLEAQDQLASQQINFGYHHNTVLVLADHPTQLEDRIAALAKCYRDANITVVRESLNLESAFWAQIPGNFSYIRRSALISSNNFADFCSMHNYSTGYIDQNHLGSAVMLVETASRTPLYLNFHERSSGNKNDLSKGHTTIIAPSNAGKTTLMSVMDAQSKKYNGTSIFFDRNQGCEIYVRAMGGHYATIQPSIPTGFNPLALVDTPANRHFLMQWLASLLTTKNSACTAQEHKHIEAVIHRNYTLPPEKRRLSILASFFPADFSRWDALQPWLCSHDTRPDGRLAYLFDNAVNDVVPRLDRGTHSFEEYEALTSMSSGSLHPAGMTCRGAGMTEVVGFDMTHLLDNEPQTVIFSVMLYLFYRIEQCADGRLIGIYLDEGWQFLDNPYWQEKLKAYLPTLRKQNIYLVFATQSPGTVARSALRDELIQGSATNIFLPNPKAESAHYIDGFKLTVQEYQWVKNTHPLSRRFLIKQAQESAIGQLNLAGLDDYIAVFSANKTTVDLLTSIRAEVGDNSVDWLPVFQARRPR